MRRRPSRGSGQEAEPQAAVSRAPSGVVYQSLSEDDREDWYLDPGAFGRDADVVAFVAQLEELGLAERRDSRTLLVPWASVYEVLEQEDLAPTHRVLPVPGVDPTVVPALSSTNSLS